MHSPKADQGASRQNGSRKKDCEMLAVAAVACTRPQLSRANHGLEKLALIGLYPVNYRLLMGAGEGRYYLQLCTQL